jgi:uncharacterized peroxidase-related enzyme
MANMEPVSQEEFDRLCDELEGELAASHAFRGSRALRTMARKPEMLRTFLAFSAVVSSPTKISHELRFLVCQVTSVAAGCRYCQAHTAHKESKVGDVAKAEAVWEFETNPIFTDAERAALRLARDAAVVPSAVTPEHFDDLRRYFDDEAILELVAQMALMALANRWNDTMATELEDEPLQFALEHLAPAGWELGRAGSVAGGPARAETATAARS